MLDPIKNRTIGNHIDFVNPPSEDGSVVAPSPIPVPVAGGGVVLPVEPAPGITIGAFSAGAMGVVPAGVPC